LYNIQHKVSFTWIKKWFNLCSDQFTSTPSTKFLQSVVSWNWYCETAKYEILI